MLMFRFSVDKKLYVLSSKLATCCTENSSKLLSSEAFFLAQNAPQLPFGVQTLPRPAGGANSAPPDSVAGLTGGRAKRD